MTKPMIVVIDNYDPMLDLVDEVLTSEGYAVQCYPERIENAACIEHVRPDLVIMDLQRANSDDVILLLGQLRRHPSTRAVPMIVVSTDGGLLRDLAAPLSQLGCGALEKPFDLEDFLDQVKRMLGASPQRQRVKALQFGQA